MTRVLFLILVLFGIVNNSSGQSFLQNIYTSPDGAIDQGTKYTLCALADGEFATAICSDTNKIALTRFDKNGNVKWSKRHKFNFKLNTRIFLLQRQNDLVVFGSLISSGLDILFLFRANENDGSFAKFKYIIPSSDKINYVYGALSYGKDDVLVYASTYGVIPGGGGGEGAKGKLFMRFNAKDSSVWCNKIPEYDVYWGEFSLLANGDFLTTSHNLISRFGGDGKLKWSREYKGAGFALAPVEINNEIFVCNYEYSTESSFIYKISDNGNMLALSDGFKGTNITKMISFGNKLVLLGSKLGSTKVSTSVTVIGTDMKIEKQFYFDNHFGFAPIGSLRDACLYDHVKGTDSSIIICATNTFSSGFYICKGDFSSSDAGCFNELVEKDNNIPVTSESYAINPIGFTLKAIGTLGQLQPEKDIKWSLQPYCCEKFTADFPSDTFACNGNKITLSVGSNVNVLWSTGETTPSITVTKNGSYTVKAFSMCDTLQDTINVFFPDIPAVKFSVSPLIADVGETVLFKDECPAGILLWKAGDGFETTTRDFSHTYAEYGEYKISHKFTDTFGCDYEDFLTVKIKTYDYYIPNAFTPNSDGKNEIFKPVGGGVEWYSMRIINRWGEIVFEGENSGWDGVFRGEILPPGLYWVSLRMSIFGIDDWVNVKQYVFLGH